MVSIDPRTGLDFDDTRYVLPNMETQYFSTKKEAAKFARDWYQENKTPETREETEEVFSEVEMENISQELKDLEAFVKRENPKFSIKPNLTTQEKQKALDDEAYRILTEASMYNSSVSSSFPVYAVPSPKAPSLVLLLNRKGVCAY